MEADVGVVVGRFQTDEFHEAHQSLINRVRDVHDKVAVVLGVSPLRATRNNPLDYMSRFYMIRDKYPEIIVIPIKDEPTDEGWSQTLDRKLEEVFPVETLALYGARDSFIPYYSGRYTTFQLESSTQVSATDIRKRLSKSVLSSREFRHGMIYNAFNQFPTVYPTVDIAVLDEKESKYVLLGRKNKDPKGKFRFFGGFVSPGETFEQAASRELYEEAGIVEDAQTLPKYLGSFVIDDWRYRKEVDKITSFFTKVHIDKDRYVPCAGDDIDEVQWFLLKEIESHIVECHREMAQHLINKFTSKRNLKND